MNIPDPESPFPVPAAARKKKRRRNVAVIASGFFLIGLIAVAVFFLGSEKGTPRGGEKVLEEQPSSPAPQPITQDIDPPRPREDIKHITLPRIIEPLTRNLAVTLYYSREPRFLASIEEITYTDRFPSRREFISSDGVPFSIIQLVTEDNVVLYEEQFSVAFQVILDSPDELKKPEPIVDGRLEMILPVEKAQHATKIVIRTPDGTILDQARLDAALVAQGPPQSLIERTTDLFTIISRSMAADAQTEPLGVRLEIQDPSSCAPNSQLHEYKISLTNSDSTPITHVQLYYQPNDVSIISSSPEPSLRDANNTRAIWLEEILNPGESRTYSVTIQQDSATPTQIFTYVKYEDGNGVFQLSYADHIITPCKTASQPVEISLHTSSSCITPGDPIDISLSLTNTSSEAASDLEVTYASSDTKTLISNITPKATSDAAGKVFWASQPDLAPDESQSYSLTIKSQSESLTPFFFASYKSGSTQYTTPFHNTVLHSCNTQPAPAQAVQGSRVLSSHTGSGAFTIAVINDNSASAPHVSTMILSVNGILIIEPWTSYSSNISIVPITNLDTDLNCTYIGLLPRCSDIATITARVAKDVPNWNTIIVVTSSPCNCGSVDWLVPAPPIAAVGYETAFPVIAHELGHSVGQMEDEYLYQLGVTSVPSILNNCFLLQSACENANIPFVGKPGAECSLGCVTTTSWRPSTRIMHNTYEVLEYGPLEECLMRTSIGAVIGTPADCDSVEDKPPYWGWRRGL